MFRIFIGVLSFLSLLNANDLTLVKLTLDKSFDGYGVVKSDKDITIGSSGVITQQISEGLTTIVARVIVSKKIDEGYEVAYRVFDDLAQDALPYPNTAPKKGDEVQVNYLYKRVVPIVPNMEAMNVATQKYSDIDFLEPDLFASYLSKNNIEVPNKGDFKRFCQKNGTALLYFGMDDGGRFVDCYSFVTVKKDKVMYQISQPQLPFYSRIKEFYPSVMESFFNAIVTLNIPFVNEDEQQNEPRESTISDFYTYYKSLIKG